MRFLGLASAFWCVCVSRKRMKLAVSGLTRICRHAVFVTSRVSLGVSELRPHHSRGPNAALLDVESHRQPKTVKPQTDMHHSGKASKPLPPILFSLGDVHPSNMGRVNKTSHVYIQGRGCYGKEGLHRRRRCPSVFESEGLY